MVKAKKKLNASSSSYSKKKAVQASAPIDEEVEDEFAEDDYGDELEGEPIEEDPQEQVIPASTHIRSNGLFNNVWWKKGLLKGIVLWLVFVVIFYVFDLLGMVEVIDWKRWAFFLIFLALIGMAYEKFMVGRIQI
jgi:hypothetical protein